MAKLRTQTFEGVFPTFFPITDGIETYSVTLDGFDKGKGFLVGAAVEFVGTLTSTAFFQDLFGFYASIGTAETSVYGEFSAGKGQPAFWATDLSLIGFGSALVPPFATGAAPVNASNIAFGFFQDPGKIKDETPIEISLDVVGGFSAFPFATLPQGDVVIGAEVTYAYVKNRDIIKGNSGDNALKGTGETDVIRGRGGDDRLSGKKGVDFLLGQGGNDRLFGGGGEDSLSGGTGKDKLYGGGQGDILQGNQMGDVIRGGGGEDFIFGGSGNDRLLGQGKGDYIIGGGGRDMLIGGSGGDKLEGGNGNDRLDGGQGTDIYTGGRGADTFVLRDNDPKGAYVTDFGRGNDVIDISDFNVARKDVKVLLSEEVDEVVLVIKGTVEVVLQGITEVGDVTNEMILL